MSTHETAALDAAGNPLAIGDLVTIGWRDSSRPKEVGRVRNLASRVTIDTATHHELVVDYRDVIRKPDDEQPHVGHWSRLGGTWWCDTCNSPYCELA